MELQKSASSNSLRGKRVLFLVAEDWLFSVFRIPLALALIERGAEVAVACRVGEVADEIRRLGVAVHSVPFARESLSPVAVTRGAWSLRRLLQRERSDLIHAVALRPILLGWMAMLPTPGQPVINAVTGLGSLFTSEKRAFRLRLARRVVCGALGGALTHRYAYNVFQNSEDQRLFRERGYVKPNRSFLIRGSGVDSAWQPVAEPDGAFPVVIYVGRLLADKGLRELVAASCQLQEAGFTHVLRIVGDSDPCNPTSLQPQEIESWRQHPWIELVGRRRDVLAQMSAGNVVVLPSYREGLPKVLLEAGVAQRAVVTTDVPGCRELVRHEENGLLVPVRDSKSLGAAIKRLWEDAALRDRLARAHRNVVCEQYSMRLVVEAYLELYGQALSDEPGEVLSGVKGRE